VWQFVAVAMIVVEQNVPLGISLDASCKQANHPLNVSLVAGKR
jgi:hypothetical protein